MCLWGGCEAPDRGRRLACACRAGRPGTVVSLVSGGERFVVEKLGRRLGVPISEVQLSGGEAAEKEPPAAEQQRQPHKGKQQPKEQQQQA